MIAFARGARMGLREDPEAFDELVDRMASLRYELRLLGSDETIAAHHALMQVLVDTLPALPEWSDAELEQQTRRVYNDHAELLHGAFEDVGAKLKADLQTHRR